MRKRGKQASLQRLGNVLAGILKKHNIFFDSEEQLLLDVWQKAVGPQISVQTRPDRLKRNTLFVKVSSSVWMHQLHILKQDIIEKINQLLGKDLIKNIHFSIGEIPSTMPTSRPDTRIAYPKTAVSSSGRSRETVRPITAARCTAN